MIMPRELLAEGKTKKVWRCPLTTADVLLELKDDVTAGDGARRSQFDGKGAYSARTAANCFRLLKAHGVPNHFVGDADDLRMIRARELRMIPIEVVVRRIATGSFLQRRPDVEEGTRFDPLLAEFFDKDDALHDPLIIYDFVSERVLLYHAKKPLAEGFLREQPMVSAGETQLVMEQLKDLAIRAFTALEAAWAEQSVTLVDFKIECGHDVTNWHIIIGDVITNDDWRLWPGGDKKRQLDKQTFREAPEATREVMDKLKADYARVADMTDAFKLPAVMPAALRR